MGYCRTFIDGIRQINVSKSSAQAIHQALLASAHQSLLADSQHLQATIASLPEKVVDNPSANIQLQAYRAKQKEALSRVDLQLDSLVTEASQEGIDLAKEVDIDDAFITSFASYFRDIHHLADTLSDAPPVIKALQTKLYVEILLKLDKGSQERQLQILSTRNIQDMLEQAIATYDNSADDDHLRHQCQHIVQMGFFEIVRRDCEKVMPQSTTAADYQQSMEFLRALNAKLPEVGWSTVIDNLSHYQNTAGQTIGELLFDTEQTLKLTKDNDWAEDGKIQALQQSRALLHKLRFGQEDRREYIKKRQENMARDLFWARNIRDIELFTKSPYSDEQFSALAEHRYLKSKHSFTLGPVKTSHPGGAPTLEQALMAVKAARKEANIPAGDLRNPLSPQQQTSVIKLIKEKLQEESKKPVISMDAHGKITIEFVYFDTDKMKIEQLLGIILRSGGFNLNAETMINAIVKDTDLTDHMHYLSLTGNSLAEISANVDELDDAQRAAYQVALATVKDSVQSSQVTNSSQLRLDNSKELQLRKLLELHLFYQRVPPIPRDLNDIFKKIEAGDYDKVLKISNLETIIEDTYTTLADMDEAFIAKDVRPIFDKAKTIHLSSKERKEKLDTLNDAFLPGVTTALRVEKIAAVFMAEYHDMAPTLGLSDQDNPRVKKDITLMAEDLARLIERTQAGLPALTEAEQEAYFRAIQQIAVAIDPATLNEVQFKIPHSINGQQTIAITDQHGSRKTIEINITTPLPYSLIKLPGDGEFIFSYGGSRGVIAPFQGFDEAYAGPGKQKARFFTHSRLLGVGQYGSVKEVEGLLSGLNQVIKKGYVPSADKPTFQESARGNLRTRPITARNDPLYRVESDILQTLSLAEQKTKKSLGNGTRYWLKEGKERVAGTLYKDSGKAKQYQILMDRAKGDTFADLANRRLNQYSKGDISYHDPSKEFSDGSLKDLLVLSQALVTEAERFAALGFAHNDIKPENFLFKQNPEGSYAVKYIDWATGGFERAYTGDKRDIETIFAELFGRDLTPAIDPGGKICSDEAGRFVQKDENGGIHYGINPRLEILHGARNCTLPYVSPQVLGQAREHVATPAGVSDSGLDTKLKTYDPMMDDWALTAMTFGICNRQAYFALVKGRAVADYVVPGILEPDGQEPLGLKIIDVERFNAYFACSPDDQMKDDDLLGSAYTKQDAVMYIPANQREGEPLHLYRRLQYLRQECAKDMQGDRMKQKIVADIDSILNQVHAAVASGKGLSKDELQTTLGLAETCLKNYEKLHDASYQQGVKQAGILQSILSNYLAHPPIDANALLKKADGNVNELDVLCTYPKSRSAVRDAVTILKKALNADDLHDKCLGTAAPCRHLFQSCIATGQTETMCCLLSKIPKDSTEFIELVREQGLLHYALEQGMTEVAETLVSALKTAGATDKTIFDLILLEYGPGKDRIAGQSHIKWATNAFHIVIRNNSEAQLKLLLSLLPKGHDYDETIAKALHLCAVFANPALFKLIEGQYNQRNPSAALTAEKILQMVYPPDDTSPYHLFLQDEATLSSIDWEALKTKPDFLLKAPSGTNAYPCLIAAEHGNFVGVERLLQLARDSGLSPDDFQVLFKQTDDNGKTLLNHILEQGQLDYLPPFIEVVKAQCGKDSNDVLVHLLSNIHPVNPLRNFLSTTTNTPQTFQVLHQLLDAVCKEFATSTLVQQQARIVALLVNKEWLVNAANNTSHHQELRHLLHNNALSMPFKQFLFEILKEAVDLETEARTFYDGLLAEVSLVHTPDDTQMWVQERIIRREVATQRKDIDELIKSFTQEIDGLQQQVTQLTRELNDVTKELNQQTRGVTAVKGELEDTKSRLQAVQSEALTLHVQAELRLEEHHAEMDRIRLELRRVTGSRTELRQQLEVAQDAHQLAMSELQDKLSTLESGRQSLESTIAAQLHSLGIREAEVGELGVTLAKIRGHNSTLTEALETRDAQNHDLQQQLEEQRAATVVAKDKVQSLEVALATSHHGCESLQEEVARLRGTNGILAKDISTLRGRVAQLSSALELTNNELAAQRLQVGTTLDKLRESRRELAEARHQTEVIHQAAEQSKATHAMEVKRIQSALDALQASATEDHALLTDQLHDEQRRHQTVLDELQAQLSTVKLARESLALEFETQKHLLTHSTQQISGLKLELEDINAKNASLIEAMRRTGETSQAHHRELQQLLEAQLAKTARALSDVGSLEQELATSREAYQVLQKEMTLLKDENSRLAQEITTLHSQVYSLQSELVTTRSDLDTQRERERLTLQQLEDIKQILQAVKIEEATLRTTSDKRIRELESEVSSIQARLETTTAEGRQQLQLALEGHQREMGELKDNLLALETVKQSLTGQLEEQAQTLSKSVLRVTQLESDLALMRTRNTSLASEIENTRELSAKQMEALRKRLEEQISATDKSATEAQALRVTLERTQGKCIELVQANEQLMGANEDLLGKVGTLTEQMERTDAQLEHIRQVFVQSIFDAFETRMKKATNVLETRAASITDVSAWDSRVAKHEADVDSINRRWKSGGPFAESDERKFQRYVEQWEAIRHRFDEVRSRLTKPASLSPAEETEPISASTLAEPRSEPESPPLEAPLSPSLATPPPASPPAVTAKAKDSNSFPAVHRDSWMKIYASLHHPGEEEEYSSKTLFKQSEGGILITVNFAEQELTKDQVESFVSSAGLKVESPSGQEYSFKLKDKTPKAVLSERGVLRDAKETPEEHQQRLAVTITNMIDNVLSKGTIARVHTKDPFIAKIAELYIKHLKVKVGLSISFSEITGCSTTKRDENTDSAEKIFSKLCDQYSKEKIEKAPWYKEAIQLRTEPPDAHDSDSPSLER